ncbi:flagellar filament capping protein FliD [Vreelandella sp. EE27]
MATITSLGVGSGLDLTGLLDQLQDAERGRLAPITQQKKDQTAKISAFGQLQTSLNGFQDALGKVNDPKLYQSLSANVRGDAIKATTSAEALPGSYRVEVTQLATAGTWASTGVANRDQPVELNGSDQMTLTLGDGKSVTLALKEGSTLEDIRNALNANKEAGVNATIVNDGSENGFRLALSSKTTGQEASIESLTFSNSATPDDAIATAISEDIKRVGENARLTVNGIAITSEKNEIAGAIQGVTLNLNELSLGKDETATSTVVVERDTLKQREAVNGFVKAFNELKTTIGKLTNVTGERATAGELVGDNSVRIIESRLRSVLTGGVQGGEFNTLNQLGITLESDGKLKVDDNKLSDIVANNPKALSDFFAGDKKEGGLAGKLGSTVEQMLGSNGVVKLAITGAESRVKGLDDRFARMEKTVDATIARYRSQFGKLDAMVAQMNSMSSYLTQQFDALDSQLGRKK